MTKLPGNYLYQPTAPEYLYPSDAACCDVISPNGLVSLIGALLCGCSDAKNGTPPPVNGTSEGAMLIPPPELLRPGAGTWIAGVSGSLNVLDDVSNRRCINP